MRVLKKTVSSNYIQQHLANERTYLAWIRTSIAIIGIGFLMTNIHFTFLSKLSSLADTITMGTGIVSIISGIAIVLFSTYDYLKKMKQIDAQTFEPSKNIVIFLSFIILVFILGFAFYFMIII
ncbi:DUF202 domain-containing protein [Metabacillus idriensis]|nr:DUF202 domain-containing protein [Metabacillus idriensis]MDR0138678.1 DUF202 domain-containing protein [Metabacillus idriensis]